MKQVKFTLQKNLQQLRIEMIPLKQLQKKKTAQKNKSIHQLTFFFVCTKIYMHSITANSISAQENEFN